MGLLSSINGPPDWAYTVYAADCVAEDWNASLANIHGFKLFVNHPSIVAACQQANDLFSSGLFPAQPGPFKRAAAFVIMGRLYPFYLFKGELADEISKDEHQRAQWLARLMALSIPAVLSMTQVKIGENRVILNDWQGFPSPHYKLEFVAWLRWLDNFDRYKKMFLQAKEWQTFSMERLARMVMSTSLMIEACYYINPNAPRANSIQSKVTDCLSSLDEDQTLDLIYDYLPPEKAT